MSPLLAVLAFQATDPYLQLASAIPAAEWASVESFVEGKGGSAVSFPADTTPLVVQQRFSEKWSNVLQGLRKVSDAPYTSVEVDDTQIVVLEKFVTYAARAKFAVGERKAAVTLLLDGLTMARRMTGKTQSDCQALVLRSFAKHLDQIPLADCDRVRAAVDDFLGAVRGRTFPETGLQLLRLHMRIEAYRWQYLKLPASLKEAAPEEETLEVPDRRPFRYEQSNLTYKLTSSSSRATLDKS